MQTKRYTDEPDEISFCKDGSRIDSGSTGVSKTWCTPGWKTQKTYLSTNTEVFHEKLYTIGEALDIALSNGRVRCDVSRQPSEPRWTKIHIRADSQVAIGQLQHTSPCSEQWLV